MTEQALLPPITGIVTVPLPIAHAFEVFTGSIDTWWPHQYHIGQADIAEVVLEPHVGGRWFEKGVDGSECDWGRVLAWEPPQRVVFTWQINGMWQFDPDPEHASEVDIQFTAEGAEVTRVDVEHRHFERLVAAQGVHEGLRNGGGWKALLDAYSALANKK